MEQWYLRSAGRADAHRGELDSGTGTVTARCGVVFTPEPALFGSGPAMLSPPIDLAQCCPVCRNASADIGSGGWGRWDHDTDGAAVRDLAEAL